MNRKQDPWMQTEFKEGTWISKQYEKWGTESEVDKLERTLELQPHLLQCHSFLVSTVRLREEL